MQASGNRVPRRGAATLEASVEDESWSCANTCPSPRTPHSGSEGKPAISSSAAPRTRSARRWHTRSSAACPHTSWAAAATWSSSTQGSPDSSCASPSVESSCATGRALRCAPAPGSFGTGWCKPWWHAVGPESSACRGSPGRSAARRSRTWAPTAKRSPRAWSASNASTAPTSPAGSSPHGNVLSCVAAACADLAQRWKDIASFPAEGGVRVRAAWLVEHAGFPKGYRGRGGGGVGAGAGISTRHALALVNLGGTSADLLRLAEEVRAGVEKQFGIRLAYEPEVVRSET